MQRRPLWIMAGIVAAAVILAAGAVGLMHWPAARSNAQTTPTTSPTAASIPAPTWTAGQSWTYNVSVSRIAPAVIGWYGYSTYGLVTEKVLGTVSTGFGDAYNVSVAGTFGMMGVYRTNLPQASETSSVTLTGFTWYRTTDLATIASVRSTHLEHNVTVRNATWSTDFTANLWVDYDPPLATWQFPLQANASWNVSSNATVHYSSSYKVIGTNVSLGGTHFANATIPIRFRLQTADFANLTTPAGTFWSLRVSAVVGPVTMEFPDHAVDLGLNATTDILSEPLHPIMSLWFSAKVGNVVKAIDWFGPARFEADLVSYS
jgi:hypothetical protein